VGELVLCALLLGLLCQVCEVAHIFVTDLPTYLSRISSPMKKLLLGHQRLLLGLHIHISGRWNTVIVIVVAEEPIEAPMISFFLD
jgi:hypothetical protein